MSKMQPSDLVIIYRCMYNKFYKEVTHFLKEGVNYVDMTDHSILFSISNLIAELFNINKNSFIEELTPIIEAVLQLMLDIIGREKMILSNSFAEISNSLFQSHIIVRKSRNKE